MIKTYGLKKKVYISDLHCLLRAGEWWPEYFQWKPTKIKMNEKKKKEIMADKAAANNKVQKKSVFFFIISNNIFVICIGYL